MIPIRDELPTRKLPIITVSVIIINVIVFIYELLLGPQLETFLFQAGLVPAVLWGRVRLLIPSIPPFLTIFTSMFLHGNLFHLLSNMLYFWIFGNNVEDFLGHFHFLLFYLGCGLMAGLTHALVFPSSTIPTVGASGAISGVMGGYLVLFPFARVLVLVIWGFFFNIVRVPAALLLGIWVFLQLIYSLTSLVSPTLGGTAWFAHLGGFAIGCIWCKIASTYYERKVYW